MQVSTDRLPGLSRGLLGLLLMAAGLVPSHAAAFCGFYVTGADTSLYANATMVVLMRDGTRTVLSMQNNYQGPPEAFALVIPVPTVLTQDQVKILPKEVFQHVDALGAPRLVEYWEGDPCAPQYQDGALSGGAAAVANSSAPAAVKVEAQFAVGEYNVVILSANDASALDGWLQTNNYNIPSGATDVLAQYVAANTKFFVAKVDPAKVTFVNGQAALSPLRFYYDTPDFSLPVRLGLLNSHGTQDLIVNILASSRYEAANYPNVTVPTNLLVQNDVRNAFPGFYEALFDKVLEKNPGAAITEYSWDSGSCDPCPTPPLDQSDLATLGADVTQNLGAMGGPSYVNYTLTRLHYRYTKDTLGEDLVFRQADALVGGRGIPDAKGNLDTTLMSGASTGNSNSFQGRYVILHPWDAAVTCQSPIHGTWGGPNGSSAPSAQGMPNAALSGTPPTAANLTTLLAQTVPSLGINLLPAKVPTSGGTSGASGTGGTGGTTSAPPPAAGAAAPTGTAGQEAAANVGGPKLSKGCASCSVGAQRDAPLSVWAGVLGALGFWVVRRRRCAAQDTMR